MDERYEAFIMADRWFYDTLHSDHAAGEPFAIAGRELPDGWRSAEQEEWIVFVPSARRIPQQGWKIHVSACLDNAERVLDTVWDYCLPRDIEFKFLRSKGALLGRISKYAPRGYSGKLVTIYPANDEACETILRELGELLDGEPNPYILSDLRWGNGPLYVRYGAFVKRFCVNDSGQIVPALEDGTGTLVPDRRKPVFYVPPWVELPEFLAPHLEARNAVKFEDLPYTIDHVVHFSNGGGIYVGEDTRTGTKVVLKEGRPHAGIDAHGNDAVRRIEREYEVLQQLAGVPGIPKAYDLFWVGEHRFLSMEYIDGMPLSRKIAGEYPLTDVTATPEDYARYTDWALKVYAQVEATVEGMHERGLVYADMHLFNVMVHEDDTIALLDFEVVTPVEEAVRPGLGNQGFQPPRGTTGFDIDRYGLACLRLAMFLPMTNPIWLHRPKARHFAEIIREYFPAVPADFLDSAVDVIAPPVEFPPEPSPTIDTDPERWPTLRDDLARSILASATPQRDDRLFPGDIQQFAVGGVGLAFGAAGVLYALSVTGAGRHPELEEWLVQRVLNPAEGSELGFYDGLHGAAFALDHLGYRQEALDTLDLCLHEDWETLGQDLRTGLAGVGLNLLHFADLTGEPALRRAAHRAAELAACRLGDEDSVEQVSGRDKPYAGLMRGSSGVALLLLRLYDDTGDPEWLDRAAVALRQDLRRTVVRDTGVLEVNEGWRTMPYLEVGSVGIGMVLDEYLARRDDEQFAEARRGVELAATSTMYILPGLFTGRAGILLYLAGRSPDPRHDPLVAKQVRNLSWHALPYEGGIAFPGTGLLRLSMDLATGTAGILLALGAALSDQPVHAPLLVPTWRPELAASKAPAPAGAGQ